MIVSNAVEASLPLAEKYADSGLQLIAKPNTPLELLNGQVKFNEEMIGTDEINVTFLSTHIEQTTSGTTEGSNIVPSMHDVYLGNITDEISKYVLAHLSFAKSDVKPKVIEYAENLNRMLANIPDITAESSINMSIYDIPAILQDESFIDMFKHTDGRTSIPPEKFMNFAPRGHDEIVSLMMTGNNSYDKDILPWATNLDPEELCSVWESVFTNTGNTEGGILTLDKDINKSLIIFLIANTLESKVENTSVSYSLDQYTKYIQQLKDMAATMLWASLKTLALYMKNDTVVLNVNQYTKSVTLLKPTYDKWLMDGGSPEIILGLIISEGIPATKGSAILALADKYSAKWETYRAYFNVTSGQTRVNNFKNAMSMCFDSVLISATEAVSEYTAINTNYIDQAKKLFSEYLDNISYKNMANINDIALDVVGKCVFFYTDSYSILKNIDEAHAINPNIDVREAATMATIAYVADYVLDQIKLVG